MTKEQKILLLFVLIIAGAGATYYFTQSNPAPTTSQTQSDTQTSQTDTTGATQVTGTVTTGTDTTVTAGATTGTAKTLTDKVSYQAPENHTEGLTVNVSLDASGKITDVTFAFDTPSNPESKHYQGGFTSSFKASTLIGTKLGDVKLSRVGGASLATGAFNHALSDLAAKANG